MRLTMTGAKQTVVTNKVQITQVRELPASLSSSDS